MSKRKNHLSVIDPCHPVDYTNQQVPPNYKCHDCGATNCKLWREYQTFLDRQTLLCAICAAKDEKRDITDIDERGRYTLDAQTFGPGQKSNQIGWYVPAVPTEANDSYWGYTSIPDAGWNWWNRLSTLPAPSK